MKRVRKSFFTTYLCISINEQSYAFGVNFFGGTCTDGNSSSDSTRTVLSSLVTTDAEAYDNPYACIP